MKFKNVVEKSSKNNKKKAKKWQQVENVIKNKTF